MNKENIQHRTNYGAPDEKQAERVEDRVFDLEDRLLDYAAAIIRLIEELPKTRLEITWPVSCSDRARRRFRTTAKRNPPSPRQTLFIN